MAIGNTKRLPLYRHWCFTFNNYTTQDIKTILEHLDHLDQTYSAKYIFQEEKGENGTPHLQGYIDFGHRIRQPSKIFSYTSRIHWERCRKVKHAINYCRKEESRVGEIYTNIEFPEEIQVISKADMASWQLDVLKIIEGPRDLRKIYWFWESTGNTGKTALAKYLCFKHKALILSGKSTDMKYGIIKYAEKNSGIFPKIIIFDVPRSMLDFLSFQGIEEVKNGLFFSGKYESDMAIFNSPHVLVFANQYPDTTKLSQDRWIISEIQSDISAPPDGVGGGSDVCQGQKRRKINALDFIWEDSFK